MDAEMGELTPPRRVKTAKTEWQDVILVCKKCSKKVGGGFGKGGKERLAKAMRKALGLKKGRKAEIGFVEVGCLGVCPKHAVTVARGRKPERFMIIPERTPLDQVAAVLGIARDDAPKA